MMVKGEALTVAFVVFDTVANAPKTGDAANLTLRRMVDGVAATITATPAEVDATNVPGLYSIALTGAENSGDVMSIGGKSATSGVVVLPVFWGNLDAAIASRAPASGALDATDLAGIVTSLQEALMGDDTRDLSDVYSLVASLTLGTGNKRVTVIVVDDSDPDPEQAAPVGVCPVLIPGSGSGYTNGGTGAILFGLNEAQYTVVLGSKPGFAFDNPYTLDVSSDEEQTVYLVAHLVGSSVPPVPPECCRVEAFMRLIEGADVVGAEQGYINVTKLVRRAYGAEDTLWSALDPSTLYGKTDSEGYCYVDVPRGFVVEMSVYTPGDKVVKKTVTIPDQETVNINELAEFQRTEPAPEQP